MPRCRAAAWLYRHRRQPWVDDAEFENLVCLFEGGVHVAAREVPREGNVRPELGMRERRAFFERLLRIDHRRERLVVYVDEVECVSRDRPRLGDDDRYRVADEVGARTG